MAIDHARRLASYGRDLSRLALQLNDWRAHGATRNGQHIRAASLAYDQVLLMAAAELGLETEVTAPLHPVDRLGLEAELSLAGLRWHVDVSAWA